LAAKTKLVKDMFNYVGSVNGQGRKLQKVLPTTSQALAVGDAVSFSTTAGTVVAATSSTGITGIIVGFVDKYGLPIAGDTIAAGTAAELVKTSDSATAASDYVLIDTNPGSLYSCEVTGTADTGWNKAGVWFLLSDKNTLNVASGGVISTYDTTDTIVHAYSYGLDPRNSARVICTFLLENMTPFV
jgi:hypothetical protein